MSKNYSELKKVDLFQAKRDFSENVAEFVRCVLKKAEINEIYRKKIFDLECALQSVRELNSEATDEEVASLKMSIFLTLEETRNRQHIELEAQAAFEYTNADRNFKRACKDIRKDKLAQAIINWFRESANLDVSDSDILAACFDACGYKGTTKTLVKSGGKKALALDVNNALKNLYYVSFEHMVDVGTIKLAQLPEVLVEKYADKPRKNKKEAKNE